jgi:two-component system, NtrC family, nitrogen regulation sensor histidine kinase NtrY
MTYNRRNILKAFRFGVFFRVFLLTGTVCLFAWLLFYSFDFVFTAVAGVIIIAALVWNLIRYVEQTHTELARFLDTIRYGDFSSSFSGKKQGKGFDELHDVFSTITEQFKQERAEKQYTIRFLETVVQHIGIGLITFNHRGEVSLINNTAKRMLDLPALPNVNGIKRVDEKLYRVLVRLQNGNRTVVRFQRDHEQMHWALYATEFVKRGEQNKIVSFQNISTELEEKEMEAWQNLTEVLAHEIMNSITPIASLSQTVHMLVSGNIRTENGRHTIDGETLQDVKDALQTIQKRSQGLMRFVNSYRDFTRIPEPEPEKVHVQELFHRVLHLMRGEFDKQQVRVELDVEPETLSVTADPQLIEQVLINLTKNALRALEHSSEPAITYKAGITRNGRIDLMIIDNGPGIRKAALEKIFIPFYTVGSGSGTKGSGIGLSLSRQIMRSHNGTLTVQSAEGGGTTFILRF